MTRLWDKGAPLDERVLRYTAGEDYALDERLVRHDVRASIAHAEMLHAQGLLTHGDFTAIRDGLSALADEHARGAWRIELADEDGQSALERRLTERIGAAGARIHLGRSRNDQVLTAIRLYLRETVAALAQRRTRGCGSARCARGARADTRRCPATRTAAGHAELGAAVGRGFCGRAARRRRRPLAGAAPYRQESARLGGGLRHAGVAASTVKRRARRLGFAVVHQPVTAVQLSRGKAEAQLLFEITLLLQDLGRFAADVLLFATQEFGFVTLPEAFTTGSSIMPQKRNPDVFELIRGRSATAQACLTEALGVCAKLPSGYHRDLQLLKFPLFRGIDSALETLAILPPAIEALQFRRERHPARSRDSRRRRGQPPGGHGGHPVPRGIPARGREIEGLGPLALNRRQRRGAGCQCPPGGARWPRN